MIQSKLNFKSLKANANSKRKVIDTEESFNDSSDTNKKIRRSLESNELNQIGANPLFHFYTILQPPKNRFKFFIMN